jgi:hypothetical protein
VIGTHKINSVNSNYKLSNNVVPSSIFVKNLGS